MYLIVGLGNVGNKYNLTRHNIGFEVIDLLSDKYDIDINKKKFKGSYGSGIIKGKKVILLKPETYMNLSGECVRPFMEYYDIDIENLFVIYDDVELPLGKLRIRKFGSSGTHNGMKSIIKNLSSDKFPRFRLGIGKDENMNLADFVLSKFREEEIEDVKTLCVKTEGAISKALEEDINSSMNEFNG